MLPTRKSSSCVRTLEVGTRQILLYRRQDPVMTTFRRRFQGRTARSGPLTNQQKKCSVSSLPRCFGRSLTDRFGRRWMLARVDGGSMVLGVLALLRRFGFDLVPCRDLCLSLAPGPHLDPLDLQHAPTLTPLADRVVDRRLPMGDKAFPKLGKHSAPSPIVSWCGPAQPLHWRETLCRRPGR
jgi:hypothetical protein